MDIATGLKKDQKDDKKKSDNGFDLGEALDRVSVGRRSPPCF